MNKKNIKTRKKKSIKLNIKSLMLYIILSAILIYILWTIYNLFKTPTNVVMVENGKLYLEEETIGYIIRDETLVQGNNYKNGIVQIKTEGQKVAKGETIFRYYTKGEEELQKKVNELNEKIDEALANEKNIFHGDTKVLEKEIDSKIDNISQSNDIQKIIEYKTDIIKTMMKKAEIAGELSPSGSYVKELIKKRSYYENQLNSGTEKMIAPVSGMISYKIDGLENTLSAKDFTSLSKGKLEELNLKTGQVIATSNEAGKIINNFECYIATIMNSEKAKEAKVSDNVKLRLTNNSEIPAKIEYIFEENNKDRLIVFKVSKEVEELVNYRKISFDVIWWSYSGLKVPNSAIIEEEGKPAYVIRNKAGYLNKVLVKVLRKNENYSIVSAYTNSEIKEEGYDLEELDASINISLYDEILIKPKIDK